MTLRQFFILDGIESPFFKDGQVTPADIALFIWILSPEYSPGSKARDKFLEKITRLDIATAVKDIKIYLSKTFSDSETNEGSEKKQYANFIAYLVDIFGKEYGWTPETILELPLRQLYQMTTAISERYARLNGNNYTKLRAIDMMEAQALLDQARKQKQATN